MFSGQMETIIVLKTGEYHSDTLQPPSNKCPTYQAKFKISINTPGLSAALPSPHFCGRVVTQETIYSFYSTLIQPFYTAIGYLHLYNIENFFFF